MRARILSPLSEKVGVVGVVWLDCDFDGVPKVNDSLTFSLQGITTSLLRIIDADINISPPDINYILITDMINFNAGPWDAAHSAGLLLQGWRREIEQTPSWPENTEAVALWMAEVSLVQPNWMSSWARAVAGARDLSISRCNLAEQHNGKWIIEQPIRI